MRVEAKIVTFQIFVRAFWKLQWQRDVVRAVPCQERARQFFQLLLSTPLL